MSYAPTLSLLAVFVPFLVIPIILALRGRPNPREGASLAAAIATFGLVAAMLPDALGGGVPGVVIFTAAPGLELALRPDLLGLLFAVVSSFLWILTTIYNIGYMRGLEEHAQTRYYAFFAAVIGATMGIALSTNLFSLLIFYEILTISTYPLVIHHEGEEDYRSGRKYLVYTLGGGGAVLAALALAYGTTGDVSFQAGGNTALAALAVASPDVARAVAFLMALGFGVKSTLVPFHGWLPSAMVAPTPVSGLLHAVAVVKAGVFGVLRTLYFFVGPDLASTLGLQTFLIGVASLTIIVGSLFALVQDNLKLRLAYSTISQLSYIVLGAALLTPASFLGASFHIAAHGFAKLSMFFVAGAILVRTGKTNISQMDGVGRQMPYTMGAFALAVLGLSALPPTAPFVSKFFLTTGAAEADLTIPVIVLLTSSILNMLYFFPIVARAFVGGRESARSEASVPLLGPVLATALGALVLGVWLGLPGGPFEMAKALTPQVLLQAPPAFEPWASEHLLETLVVILAALVLAPLAVLEFRGEGRPFQSNTVLRGLLGICGGLQRAFGLVYDGVVAVVTAFGRVSRRLQTGDLNLNTIGMAIGLILALLWLLWGRI